MCNIGFAFDKLLLVTLCCCSGDKTSNSPTFIYLFRMWKFALIAILL